MVSCISPTHNRRAHIPRAIERFLAQDHPSNELIILDDGTDSIADLIPNHPSIHYTRLDHRHTIGAKRNLACQQASGDIILHWDDDDWYADWRISYQVSELLNSQAQLCGLDRLLYHEPSTDCAWEYIYPRTNRPWLAGNTLCYRKSYWQQHRFAEVDIGEDSRFVWQARPGELISHDKTDFIVATIHPDNISPKVTRGSYWNPQPSARVHALMGTSRTQSAAVSQPPPQVLVAASRGIGDILRITPLVAVLHKLGYAVDLQLCADSPQVAGLLGKRPEIRTIYTSAASTVQYDLAIFTAWSTAQAASTQASRKILFDRNEWLTKGDTHCITQIAVQLGWTTDLPLPFAHHSGRDFHLPPGTVAIHPGCKPDWPWKKWHGFDELAALLPNVAVIGTHSDLDNSLTYFNRDFQWPSHARNFIDKLSLSDTAALLSQCAALVSNDSGMMHLGVALGIPTFGIFGITSPQREIMHAPNMISVTKGLACEASCRQKPFGRRDCEHHLRCLKTLTAQEIVEKLNTLPGIDALECHPLPSFRKDITVTEPLTVAYHGHVFDASGYGQAARAYVHALHAAGVKLSVVDLSTHPRQVGDQLVESLLGPAGNPDFQLFHGVPHVWARQAFQVPNAIAMTVWETDTMPTQWGNTLNHALETWLPCDHNIDAFRPFLRRPLAKIPHPILCRGAAAPNADAPNAVTHHSRPNLFDLSPATFLIYSIFAWQDRKSPLDQMIAYLRAFSAADDTALVFKTNPEAANLAAEALEQARRNTGSDAKVLLFPEAWSEDQIAALQARGDCYLSLHRGEGWGYPLFEAACAGTPVVATAHSGPLEYLDPEHHQLVRCTLASVKQPYMYYHARMKWAQPDLDDAVTKLRWVYEHREQAGKAARESAARSQKLYSLESVGNLAKARLVKLLETTNRARWQTLRTSAPHAFLTAPPRPIPDDWFDADYFDLGIKSNWRRGYHWKHFEGLFRETAAFLKTMFPSARSCFDAGCAKGFLVRTLREAGLDAHGCDISSYAIQNADNNAASYLEHTAAELAEWSRSYDLLLSLHLLPQMTEQQIALFLERARPYTTTALVAVIPLFDDASQPDTGDQGHITCHTRDWWHQRILAAGWQQDPLHAAMQQACQHHPFPTRMGWQLFIYSPGVL